MKKMMKNLGMLLTVLMTTTNAFAGTELVCGAKGRVDGIIEIHAQDSYPAKQFCAILSVQKNSFPKQEVKICSKGSIDDSTLLFTSEVQTGIGTTELMLQRTQAGYTLIKTFDCDWVNGEEHCGMNTPTQILAKEEIDCMMVRE